MSRQKSYWCRECSNHAVANWMEYICNHDMWHPIYQRNGFVTTYALGHKPCNYTLLVQMEKGVPKKLKNEQSIRLHKWPTTHWVPKSQRSRMGIIDRWSWRQFAVPVMSKMALWQFRHLHVAAPMIQRVLNKLRKEPNMNGHKRTMTYSVLKSDRGKMGVIYL